MIAPARTSAVGEFLHALGQALSTMTLYGAAHPSRAAARVRAHERISAALVQQAPLHITLLDGDVIVDRSVLHDFSDWDWGARLAAAGVQRIEFEHDVVDADAFGAWLEVIHAAVSGVGAPVAQATLIGPIRFGPVALANQDARGGTSATEDPAQSSVDELFDGALARVPAGEESRDGLHAIAARLADSHPTALREEVEAFDWVRSHAAETNRVPVTEVEAIIRGLSMAMQAEHGSLLPLIALKSADQYTTVHACNVAMLSMGLAEQVGFASRDVRTIGVAALLHDIGKVRLPDYIQNQPEALTDSERAVIRTHPAEGAKLLGERGSGFGLASIVAYEHHMWANGQGGYPGFGFARTPHYMTRLVQVCDVYDALCTNRPYRPAWPRARTLHHMRLQAGRELDYDLLLAFFDLIDKAEKRQSLPR
jgi:putative nucleotidyltransferase with HDIG domain